MKPEITRELELLLLEDLEAVGSPLGLRIFMGVGVNPEYFNTSREYETLRSMFPRTKMTKKEILEIATRERLGQVLFFAKVDGSKLPNEI